MARDNSDTARTMTDEKVPISFIGATRQIINEAAATMVIAVQSFTRGSSLRFCYNNKRELSMEEGHGLGFDWLDVKVFTSSMLDENPVCEGKRRQRQSQI